jgi:hypothetical protein
MMGCNLVKGVFLESAENEFDEMFCHFSHRFQGFHRFFLLTCVLFRENLCESVAEPKNDFLNLAPSRPGVGSVFKAMAYRANRATVVK